MVGFCISFISCSNEEDNPVINSDVKKRLISIEYRAKNEGWHKDEVGSLKLEYENGKVVKTVDRYTRTGYNSLWTTTFNYDSDKSITGTLDIYISDEGQFEPRTVTYTLNGNGYIVERKESNGDDWNYSYTNDYLTTATPHDLGYKGRIDKYTFDSKGCMTNCRSFEGGITYTDIPNVGGLYIAYQQRILDTDYINLLYARLLGNAPKYLPKTAINTDGDTPVYDYSYEFDKDGYVTKTTVTCEGNMQGWTETYTYETID